MEIRKEQFRQAFHNVIETTNSTRSTTIESILAEMKKIDESITKNNIDKERKKKGYRIITKKNNESNLEGIYISKDIVYDFLEQEYEDYKMDTVKSEEIFKFLVSFGIRMIKIYEIPMYKVPVHSYEREILVGLYRIKIKVIDKKLLEGKKYPVHLENIVADLDELGKIESIERYNEYLIITTMNRNFAKKIRRELQKKSASIWNVESESDRSIKITIDFDIKYDFEENLPETELRVRDRFIMYLEERYANGLQETE
jgi:hypothetical protein